MKDKEKDALKILRQRKYRRKFDTKCRDHNPTAKMLKIVKRVGAGVNIFLECPKCGRKK